MLCFCALFLSVFFFFNDTATTEIYTLSLHDALPISWFGSLRVVIVDELHAFAGDDRGWHLRSVLARLQDFRSEEHTSELQSHLNLVCRLLLEKKKNKNKMKKAVHVRGERSEPIDDPG